MPTYTITIKEEDGAVGVQVGGDLNGKSTAAFAARALMKLMPGIIPQAAREAAKHGACPCAQCRSAAPKDTPNTPQTLH